MSREVTKRAAAVADELRQVVSALVRRLRAESAVSDLSHSEHSVLRRLHDFGPSTTAALARNELVRPQSMGATLSALEEQGFIVRRPDASDARCLTVSITERGVHVLAEGRAARQNWLARRVAEELDADEQRALLDALALVRRVTGS
jgi:DNA-binding MarR family transcriptional regulator